MASTRREQLYSKSGNGSSNHDGLIPVTVQHKINKKSKDLDPLNQDQKMLCALRKVLVQMSDANQDDQRYFIADSQLKVMVRTASPGARPEDPGSYTAKGRFKLGIIHPGKGGVSYKICEFKIGFRDTKDELGKRDVAVDEQNTTIDMLPPGSTL